MSPGAKEAVQDLRKKPRTRQEKEDSRVRMYGYWNEFYKRDTESRIARALVESLKDSESLFYDEEFLQQYVDDIEKERGVKNSRWKVEK